jgi:hypothetical protein
MTIKKPGIPGMQGVEPAMARILNSIKENIELITGVRGAPISQLDSDATLEDVISRLNQLIVRINSGGE